MDEQRALLDRLMGLNRDGDRPDDAAMDFAHARVCKPWLCGLCPREVFQSAGACELLHIPQLRAAYEQSARSFGYERDLANDLARLLADVEKKIARGQKRLGEDAPDGAATQKLRVCDVCGAFLSILDSDRRLADHFGGKVHVGYMQIRRKLEELQKEDTGGRSRRDRERSTSRRRRPSRSRSRDRKRSRRQRH